jgi:DNA-binding NarL/FixJ family response regulator
VDDLGRPFVALADTCGALGLRREVGAELERAGEPVPPPAPPAPTATEQRVAPMAAEGIDERGIAEALFLTPATVRTILSAVR